MRVINVDKNGNIIKDMNKVTLPKEVQKKMIRIYYKEAKRENKIRNQVVAMQ